MTTIYQMGTANHQYSTRTDLVGNAFTLLHKRLGCFAKIRYVVIAWPLGMALQPKRLFLIVCSSAGTQLSLQRTTQLVEFSISLGSTHLVFPAVIGFGIMRCLALDLGRKIEELLGYRELTFNLFDGYSMVHQCEEPSILRCSYQLLGDFVFSLLKIYKFQLAYSHSD